MDYTNLIIECMEEVEGYMKTKTGEDKKKFVLSLVKKRMGPQLFLQLEPMIKELIDFICFISKHKLKININSNKCNKFFCS
jgi:hypothetical protein